MQFLRYTFIILCLPLALAAQDIKLSFANPQITTDGTSQYYEVDVMVASQTEAGAFYMSSGQIYLNYNEAAFGSNAFTSSNASVFFTTNTDYLLNQKDNSMGVANVYSTPLLNDNTSDKLSVAWPQEFAGNCIAKGVTLVPTPLFHLKIKYLPGGTAHEPHICFENSDLFISQFFIVCMPLTEKLAVVEKN